jgi:hypothetical protein
MKNHDWRRERGTDRANRLDGEIDTNVVSTGQSDRKKFPDDTENLPITLEWAIAVCA